MFKFRKNNKENNNGNGQAPADRGDSKASSRSLYPAIDPSTGEDASNSSSDQGTSPGLTKEEQAFPITGWKTAAFIGIDEGKLVFVPNSSTAEPYTAELTRFACMGHSTYEMISEFHYEPLNIFCEELDEDPVSPCGFYSVRSKDILIASGYFKKSLQLSNAKHNLVLEVDHFGKVIEYEKVIRAEYQRVISMHVTTCHLCDGTPDMAVSIGGTVTSVNRAYECLNWLCKEHYTVYDRVIASTKGTITQEDLGIKAIFTLPEVRDQLGVELYVGPDRKRVIN